MLFDARASQHEIIYMQLSISKFQAYRHVISAVISLCQTAAYKRMSNVLVCSDSRCQIKLLTHPQIATVDQAELLLVQAKVQILFANAASMMQGCCCFQGHNLTTALVKSLLLRSELAMAARTCRIVSRSWILLWRRAMTSRFTSFSTDNAAGLDDDHVMPCLLDGMRHLEIHSNLAHLFSALCCTL